MIKRFFTPLGILAAVFLILAAWGFYGDLATLVTTGEWRPLPLGRAWAQFHIDSLNLVQAVVERYISPWLWWNVLFPTLNWPTWVIPLTLGLILLVLKWTFRKGRPLD